MDETSIHLLLHLDLITGEHQEEMSVLCEDEEP